MKLSLKLYSLFATLFLTILSVHAQATHFVDPNCANPVSPYTDWSTAATNIQEAVDAASTGDLVLVTNGVYSSGGRVFSGTTTNRVLVNSAITVESVNGPGVTVIQAYPTPGMTNGSMRCVLLEAGAVLSGFALMNGSVTGIAAGGVGCASGNCIVSNCVIVGNWAQGDGGGGEGGSYYNCIIGTNGSAGDGGGVCLDDYNSAMFNCLVISNNASRNGGGIYTGNNVVSNCVITFNSVASSGTAGGGGYDGQYYNCIISGNSCPMFGGGLCLETGSPGEVVDNCLIVDNYSGYFGGGVFSFNLVMNNCTIARNSSYNYGAGIYVEGTPAFLTNCIVYYNSLSEIGTPEEDLFGITNVCNCCTPTVGGVNDFAGAPGFVNVDGNDFHLAAWSRCIDAGTNAAVTSSVDLDGNPRIVNGTVDIGAYEYQDQFTNLIHYVSLNSANSVSPFTNWLTAATNIQSAIDISSPSDFIVVSNGIYNKGGRLASDATTNRVVVDVPVTVQGLSGLGYTFIQGNYPNSPGTRCAYVTNGATLIGFTFTNGQASTGGNTTNNNGGGVWSESSAATVISCDFAYDRADSGGGAYSGTLIDCLFNNDVAQSGGGAFLATLMSCVLTNNSSGHGAGACFGVLSNCMVAGNYGVGAYSNVLYDCMVVSNSANYGAGAYWCDATNTTFIGNFAPISGGGAYSSILSGCTLIGNIAQSSGGGAYSSTLGNCTLIGDLATNSGGGEYSSTLNNCTLSRNWAPNGGAAAYGTLVNCTLTNNTATNGGGAFGATLNDCILSSNSAASYGGGAFLGTLSYCAISNNIAYNGGGVASNTLYNCTVAYNDAYNAGGGSYGGTLNGCLIFSNEEFSVLGNGGGGSFASVLVSCDLFDNLAFGHGGGACLGVLTGCILSNNVASVDSGPIPTGGGADSAILTNCLIIGNKDLYPYASTAGGTFDCYLNNCTIAFNTGHGTAAGVYGGGATNCILYYNVGGVYSNWNAGTFVNCCTLPLPTGANSMGNFTNAPLFLSTNDFHLQSTSPCINSGNNRFIASTTDLDGNPRIVGSTVDVGAYEYQTPASIISYAYLQEYGLPTDGSVDYADLDGTVFNVYQDWIAGLNPTNPASILAMLTPVATNNTSGLKVSWQSVSGILYNLQRSTNLAAEPPFSIIRTNISGLAGTSSYQDTTATNNVPYFYRVDVSAE